MELSTAFASLRRGWPLLLAGLLAGVAVAAILHRTQDPVYASTGTYLVVPSSSDPDIVENVKTLDATRSRTILTTLTEIMTSDSVAAGAGASAGVDPARYEVTAAALPEANGVTLRVVGPDPVAVPTFATVLAGASAERFVALYRIYEVSVLDPPQSPADPAGKSLPDLLVLAGGAGFAAGAAAALVRGPDRRRRPTMARRIDAYSGTVTPLRERDRIPRAG